MKQGRIASIPNVTSLLAAFFAIAVATGIVASALVIPGVAMFGASVKTGVGAYDSLPADFQSVVPNQQTTVYASDGKTEIATLYDQNRVVVPLSQIAPIMRKAQVAIEDKRFYEHGGVDLRGIAAAVAGKVGGGAVRGASTLTQQYVKVTLETAAERRGDSEAVKAASEVTLGRKLQELKYAAQVEKVKTKDEILQDYLNLVYFGDRTYGIEAAARHYFHTTAAKLTLTQAATLAGLVQNPSTTDPINHPQASLKRRNVVLGVMHGEGIITDAQYHAAVKAPLGTKPYNPTNSCAVSPYPYFCDFIVNWARTQPAFGKTGNEREGRVRTGGYKIVTTLDPDLQKAAQESIARRVGQQDFPPFGSAAVTTEVGTGKVRAMVQSSGYSLKGGDGKTSVNWAVDSTYGGGGGFNVGSTIKAFAIATAMEEGFGPDYTISGIRPAPATWYASDFNGCGPTAPWVVRNVEGDENGRVMTLRDATRNSVNTAFVKLVQQLGACKVREMETRLGVHLGRPQMQDGKMSDQMVPSPAAISLGSANISPMTMSLSYATFGGEGKYCPMNPIESVTDSAGKKLNLNLPGCKQVISKQVADQTSNLLQSVMTDGTGRTVQLAGGRPSIGKTGTDDGNETWFVGATPQYSTAVWVGTPNGDRAGGLEYRFNNARLHGSDGTRYYGKLQGYKVAGPIWQGIMNAASQDLPIVQFGTASSTPVTNGDYTDVPKVAGMSVSEATSALQSAGFQAQVGRRVYSNYIGRGLVSYAYPGDRALKGSTVTLRISAGVRPRAAAAQGAAPTRSAGQAQPAQPAQPAQSAQQAKPAATPAKPAATAPAPAASAAKP